MDYNVTYCNEKDFVSLTVTGELNPIIIKIPLKKAAGLLLENRCSRLLSDLRGTFSNSTIVQTYHLPDVFEEVGFQRHLSQAIIVSVLYDKIAFAETVCTNRSWKFKVFTDPAFAKNWLFTGNENL